MTELLLSLNRRFTVSMLKKMLRRCEVNKSPQQGIEGRLLYIPASSLPYHISGYTTRTHEVITALAQSEVDIRVLTRPGYPWDRGDTVEQSKAEKTVIDTITYEHVRSPSKHRPLVMFALQAAKVIEKFAVREQVSVIHAASNHENALPALLAARKLGIPFQYEMRGLWELTRASRMPAYENSAAYLMGLELEGFVAQNADRVLAISEQLGAFARQRWGIPADRFALLPNCVDPERIKPGNGNQVEANTIAYAGSLISYEGLDTLIDAVGILLKEGGHVQVNIAGDGEARTQLEQKVSSQGLAESIRFLGRLRPDAARQVLEKSALVCIPRKPYKVCEIVPPIKLVEALAMGKPVVVADLPVFRDEMGDDPPGWFFKSGDAMHLAQVLKTALSDQAELAQRAEKARAYSTSQRSWQGFVGNVIEGGKQ